jgi:GNAT superfamily N-acetyltransferase
MEPAKALGSIIVRQAEATDAAIVQEMLEEAAHWVDALGVVMWEEGELAPGRVDEEIAHGQFFIAEVSGDPAGAVKFQLEDQVFWPDRSEDDSAFIHRLVVRRRYRGFGVSSVLMRWAVERARAVGKEWLRLDCDASRPKLRQLYEGFGFQFHSFRQVGAYYVARYEYGVNSRNEHDT